MARHAKSSPSGRFVLRLDPPLHESLRHAAERSAMSLNAYCSRQLALAAGGAIGWAWAAEAVQRATRIAGNGLVGVVLFGSRARGEAHAGSDTDLLVVVDRSVPLNRALYSKWDKAPIVVDGQRVEPHFVRLPEAGRAPLGLWAEVAIDGIVLFCRDLELPSALAAIRRDIADGRIVRKTSHGQPYWVRAA
jgi:predicted nucleotidyltransferase